MPEIADEVLVMLPLIMLAQLTCSYMASRFPKLMHHLPEVAVIIVIGMLGGLILDLSTAKKLADLELFSPTLFFIAFLPPIIFNSGFHLERSLFFCNLMPILVYAILGTLLSAVVIAAGLWFLTKHANPLGALEHPVTLPECMTFGALISATDPVSTLVLFAELRVEPHLFYLVFGESVLNDAVGIVLFDTARRFIAGTPDSATIYDACGEFLMNLVGSTLVGLVLPVVLAAVIRHSDIVANPTLEQGLVVLFLWVPYLVGESLGLSGIVATLGAGMASRKFIVPNLNEGSEEAVIGFMRLLSGFMETAAFLNLGLCAVLHEKQSYNPGMIGWAILLCCVSRPLQVYLFSWLLNRDCAKSVVPTKVKTKTQHMLSFSGLRGVVAFALAMQWPDDTDDDDDDDDDSRRGHKNLFKATTSMVILFTVFVQGGLTYSMLQWLDIELGCDEQNIALPEEPAFVRIAVDVVDRLITPFAYGFLPWRPGLKERRGSGLSRDSLGDDIIGGNLLRDGRSFDGGGDVDGRGAGDDEQRAADPQLAGTAGGQSEAALMRGGSRGLRVSGAGGDFDPESRGPGNLRTASVGPGAAPRTRQHMPGLRQMSTPYRRVTGGGFFDNQYTYASTANFQLDSCLDEIRTRELETSIYDFAPPRRFNSTSAGPSLAAPTALRSGALRSPSRVGIQPRTRSTSSHQYPSSLQYASVPARGASIGGAHGSGQGGGGGGGGGGGSGYRPPIASIEEVDSMINRTSSFG